MFKRVSSQRLSKPGPWSSLLSATKRSSRVAHAAEKAKQSEGDPLNQWLDHVNHAQSLDLLLGRVPGSLESNVVLGLQPFFGNQAVQSMLSRGNAPAEGREKACSCGGSCASCALDAEAPFDQLLKTAAETAWENPPDIERIEDEFASEERPVYSNSTSPCSLVQQLRPGQDEALGYAPHQDSATIVCDGKGDYRVSLGWAATATCGIGDCVRGHEESHAADWRQRFPDGCKNPDGTPKPDGSQVPTGGDGYDDFLRQSECKAYTGEVPCGEALLASASDACRPTVEKQLDIWKKRKKAYCSGGC